MKNFFKYFFGAGTEIEFTNFSLAHFLPILLVAGLIYLIYRYRNRLQGWRHEELMNAEAGMGLGTEADYLILAPDFDVDAYWNTVKTNPPYFRRKTYDISCEKIIELDKANVSLVEDFKAMAASHNLTVKELMGYLTEKL